MNRSRLVLPAARRLARPRRLRRWRHGRSRRQRIHLGPGNDTRGHRRGSGGDGAAGGGTDATVTCAVLLPADEVQSILGVTPEPVNGRTFPGNTDCTWSYAKDGAAVQDFFQVILGSVDGDTSLWIATKDSEARTDSATPISIDGIGDESYTWTGQGDYRKLYVRRGERTLTIRASSALPILSTESTMIDFADRLFGRA